MQMTHLTDEELMLAADEELSPHLADEARAHLRTCPECRERAERFASAQAEFFQAHREEMERSLPPAAYARARLKAQLTVRRSGWHSSPLGVASMLPSWAWAYVCAAILIGALGVRLLHSDASSRVRPIVVTGYGAGPLVPDANLTPGAVAPLTASQVCAAGGPEEMRPPLPVQEAVFHEYGMDGAPAQQYEVDHLITPALGGTDDIRNLWPESYSSEWNAHVKDQLEDHLHELVCEGKLDLPTAQRDIATNWISAYQKYFHTERPLRRSSDLIAIRDHTPAS